MYMYLNIIFKTVFLYFFIIIVYRIMGKKEFGQLSIIDFIVSILIVQLVAFSIERDDHSVLIAIIPILVLVIVQMFLSYFTLKNRKLRQFIEGNPTVVIKNGRINFSEMSKIRYNIDDLIIQLREQGINNVESVKYAVLENNGQLSVFEKSNDYPIPFILDGNIDYQVLREINKSQDWLHNMLNEYKLKSEDVFYAFYTPSKVFIIKKSDLI